MQVCNGGLEGLDSLVNHKAHEMQNVGLLGLRSTARGAGDGVSNGYYGTRLDSAGGRAWGAGGPTTSVKIGSAAVASRGLTGRAWPAGSSIKTSGGCTAKATPVTGTTLLTRVDGTLGRGSLVMVGTKVRSTLIAN